MSSFSSKLKGGAFALAALTLAGCGQHLRSSAELSALDNEIAAGKTNGMTCEMGTDGTQSYSPQEVKAYEDEIRKNFKDGFYPTCKASPAPANQPG